MSTGERKPPRPRPILQPLERGEPFLPADDFAPKPKRPVNIGELHDAMQLGFAGVHERIDSLAVRVKRVELDAWKRRLIVIARSLAPAALGYLAHYVPELTAHIPSIIKGLESLDKWMTP